MLIPRGKRTFAVGAGRKWMERARKQENEEGAKRGGFGRPVREAWGRWIKAA